MATPEIRPYSLEELRGFVAVAKEQDDALRLTIYLWLVLLGGLREGEILRLSFLAALNAPEGIVVEGRLGDRLVPRTPYALRMLLVLRATMMGHSDDFVFGDHGKPLHREYIRRRWVSVLGFEPLAMRRSGAVALVDAAASPEEMTAHFGWLDLPPGVPAEKAAMPTNRCIEDALQELEQRLGFPL